MNPCGQVFVRTYAFLSLGQILTSGMPRCVLCLVTAQAPPGSSDHGDSPGKNTGVGCHALFQGIFPTQGSNPGILHCRWILYHLSHQGSPSHVYTYMFLYNTHTYIPIGTYVYIWASPVAQTVKNPPAMQVTWVWSPGEGNGNPLQNICWENPMDRGTWQSTVHRVSKNQTRLKWLGTHTHTYIHYIYNI